MNAKTLLILLVLTGGSAAAAVFALKSRESSVTVAQDTGRFLPDLIASINDVAAVHVKTPAASFTLEQRDGAWSLAEKGGYPAQDEPVKKLLIGLAELEKVEPKTDDPERWSRLGVEDPGAADATSKLVTLDDSSGTELASIVVGNARPVQGGRRAKQLYVRASGDDQSWLVAGEVDLKERDTDWLLKEIYAIEQDRIRSIEIEHADGEVLRVQKESSGDPRFEVQDVPEGRETRYPGVANPLAGNLRSMSLEDVQPAGEVDVEDGWLSRATVRTFEGLVLRATLKDVDGKACVAFAASYEPEPGPPQPEPEEEAPSDEGAEETEDDGEPVAEVEVLGPSPAELQAEADELNAGFAGWVYVLPQYKRTSLTQRMSDMLKEPEPEEADPIGTDERPLVIPDTLPPEIQEQIKAHQESLGNKTVVRPPSEDGGAPDVDPQADVDDESGGDADASTESKDDGDGA